MRRTVFGALLLTVAVGLSLPSAAAEARVGLENVAVRTASGESVLIVGLDHPVLFALRLNNTGNETFNGPVTIVFHVFSNDTTYDRSYSVTRTVEIAPGGSVNVSQEWKAEIRGAHRLEVYNAANPGVALGLRFEVQKTEVLRGSLSDRAIQYAWLYGMFAALFVLFVAVVRLRKPGF